MSIIQKLLLIFLGLALLPVLLIGGIFYLEAERTTELQAREKIEYIAAIQYNRTIDVITQNRERLSAYISRLQLRNTVDRYNKQKRPQDLVLLDQVVRDAREGIKSFKDISIADPDGRILASTRPGVVGNNISGEDYFQIGKVRQDVSSTIVRLFNGEIRLYLVGPLTLDEKVVGVAVIESDMSDLFANIGDYTGLGETGETNLARKETNGNALFLSGLRFDSDAALRRTVSGTEHTAMLQALDGQTGTLTKAIDYRRQEVLAVTKYLPDVGWGLVVKIDNAEVYAPLYNLRDVLLLMLFVMAVIIVFLALYAAPRVTGPILALEEAAHRASNGDLSSRVTIKSRDELGRLAKAFNVMTADLAGLYRDMEARVKAKTAELRAINAKDEAILSSIGDGVFALDEQGKIILFNAAAASITGYLESDVLGKHYKNALHFTSKGSAAVKNEFIEAALAGQLSAMSNHTMLLHKTGRQIPVADSAAPIKNASGEIMGAIIVFRDVSKELAQQQLKEEQHKRIKTIIDSLPVGVFLAKAPSGQPELINPAGIQMLGRGLDPKADKTKYSEIYDVIRKDGTPYPVEELPLSIALATSKSVTKNDIYVRKPGGKVVALRVTSQPLFDGAGKMTGALVVFSDITMERDLEIEKAKGELVSLASHQLRTPATAVKGFLSMLLDGYSGKLKPKQEKLIRATYDENERQVHLINDILFVAQADAGEMAQSKKPVDLSRVVEDVVAEHEPTIKARHQTVTITKPQSLELTADAKSMRLIVDNLLSNASKYSPEGTAIKIKLRRVKDETQLVVQDSGYGIDQKDMPMLFQKFSRIPNPNTDKVEGSGLGMYLVKKIIDLHQGHINVSSKVGKGTIVTVRLPNEGR
jgi:PAS domain S-box-containing protein